MDDILAELVRKLEEAHGSRLVSVILYGSAATGEHHAKFSDFNILCVLAGVAVDDLASAEAVFQWWREKGNPAPLLLSEAEVRTSTDCFPIEFHDMRERRRVLFGSDPIAELQVDNSFYRAQVEHELRAKQIRLRQKGAGLLSKKPELLNLMLESVSTFLVLSRHALLLSGIAAGWKKREVLANLHQIGVDVEPFAQLLDIREGKLKESSSDPTGLFARYLAQIDRLVAHVDGLEK